MRKEYDFSRGKRVAVLPSPGKTRITIMLDNEVLEHFRERAESSGSGYQTMINSALKSAVELAKSGEEELTVSKLREVLRQELRTEILGRCRSWKPSRSIKTPRENPIAVDEQRGPERLAYSEAIRRGGIGDIPAAEQGMAKSAVTNAIEAHRVTIIARKAPGESQLAVLDVTKPTPDCAAVVELAMRCKTSPFPPPTNAPCAGNTMPLGPADIMSPARNRSGPSQA